jgi:hypothetical protein
MMSSEVSRGRRRDDRARVRGRPDPGDARDLEDFRAWARSDAFPERGRIDWIDGEVVLDLSPEDLNAHGSPKTAITHGLVEVLFETVRSGRVRLVPKARGGEGRFVEIEGPPDLVVECVSDSSVTKDSATLLHKYHAAGVREYWLIDARGSEPVLAMRRHEPEAWREIAPDGEGFRASPILGLSVRLERLPPREGLVRHRLARR